jgi:hypothetical protein
MRTAIAILLLLIALTWCLSRIEEAETYRLPAMPASTWRRTAAGWEQMDAWPVAAPSRPSISSRTDLPHPGMVALFELLVASLFLAAGQSVRDAPRR